MEKPAFLPFTTFPIPNEQYEVAAKWVIENYKSQNSFKVYEMLTGYPYDYTDRRFYDNLLREISYAINRIQPGDIQWVA